MRITASRRDDIIRERDAFDADRAQRKAKYDEQYTSYRKALREVLSEVESEIKSELFSIQNLDLQVSAEESIIRYRADSYEDAIEVTVLSNEDNVHGKDKALSWRWHSKINAEGEVINETGSWSGLQATTPEQLESLRQSVAALEILNSLDWKSILTRTLPDYNEYVEYDEKLNTKRPDYEQQLMEVEIEDATEAGNVLIKGIPAYKDSTAPLYWYKVVKETPQYYIVKELYSLNVQSIQNGEQISWGTRELETIADLVAVSRETRIRKDKFMEIIEKPIETMTY